jgi:hypothetical protein
MRTLESGHVVVIIADHVGRPREQLEIAGPSASRRSARDSDSYASSHAEAAYEFRPRSSSSTARPIAAANSTPETARYSTRALAS